MVYSKGENLNNFLLRSFPHGFIHLNRYSIKGNLIFLFILVKTKERENEPVKVPEKPPARVVEVDVTTSKNPFSEYSSDAHLLSILRQQSNSQNQVIATIIGGDSYSIFAWDWYARMFEISNDTTNCHCFVIAMDEIAVVLATQQGIPVFYSTFTFDQQMQWINNIEVRQHSLYRVGHAKFDSTARIVRLGYSVLLSEMDVFWFD